MRPYPVVAVGCLRLTEHAGEVRSGHRFGYSTDGYAEDDGAIEIKCPLSALPVITVWRTRDLSEYMHQMQMGLWITGRQWIDFVMFDPRLRPVGKELFIERVERDDDFIADTGKKKADELRMEAEIRRRSNLPFITRKFRHVAKLAIDRIPDGHFKFPTCGHSNSPGQDGADYRLSGPVGGGARRALRVGLLEVVSVSGSGRSGARAEAERGVGGVNYLGRSRREVLMSVAEF